MSSDPLLLHSKKKQKFGFAIVMNEDEEVWADSLGDDYCLPDNDQILYMLCSIIERIDKGEEGNNEYEERD